MSITKPHPDYMPDEDLAAAIKNYKTQRDLTRAMQNDPRNVKSPGPLQHAPAWGGPYPTQPGMTVQEEQKQPTLVLGEAEYLVVWDGADGDCEAHCKDAEQMQKAVEIAKRKRGVFKIAVYKRMLKMESKVEWENAGCDL